MQIIIWILIIQIVDRWEITLEESLSDFEGHVKESGAKKFPYFFKEA